MNIEIIGLIGAFLLMIAWMPEIMNIVKTGKSKMDNTFTEIVLFATLILLIYSFLIDNLVFIIVNSFILFEVSISLYYSFFPRNQNFLK